MVQVQVQSSVDGGLCATCNNKPTCFHHARRGPALYCELFDDYMPPRIRDVDRGMPGRDPAPAGAVTPGAALKGLCVNCEHRRSCAFPKPPEGVWHCEEYV